MTVLPFLVRTTDYAHPLNVVGERITVLASGRKTGSYEIFLQEGPEGSGPIPHTHPWDESFFVIRGEVDFSHGIPLRHAAQDRTILLPPTEACESRDPARARS